MNISSMDPSRIIIVVVSVIVIVGYILIKWKRASNYVDGRNELFSELRQQERAYTERVKQDARWPVLFAELQKRYPVTDGEAADKDTYQVHYLSILDPLQKKYEPNEPGSESASLYAFIKRKSKPRYLQLEMSPDRQYVERKIGGMQWYDLFEKSV